MMERNNLVSLIFVNISKAIIKYEMKHKCLLLLMLILTFYTPGFAEYFRQIGLSDGLTQPSVMAIHQDQLGRMWFGTREGINMYDGNQITTFKGWSGAPEESSSIWLGNDVASIVDDKFGNIFFLIDKDIIRLDIRTEKFNRLSNDKKVSVLTSFEGDIWYMKYDSLFCYHAEQEESAFMLKTNITSSINCLTLLSDRICIGTRNGVLSIDRASMDETHILKGMDIYQIFESSQKELWLGTRMHGLYRMKDKGEAVPVPYAPNSPLGISSWQIRNFVEDGEHNIWFGTFDGLQKYDAKSGEYSLIQIPKDAGGLNHPSIFSLYKDVQGTIWIGSYFGGVNYFTPKQESFVHYDYDHNALKGLYYSYIGDIIVDKDEHIWLCTDGGGICCIDKKWNIIHQFTADGKNSLPHNNVKSISYDEKNDCLYIGTYLGGLSRYDMRTGQFHNYLDKNGGDGKAPNEVVYHVKMWKDQLFVSARNGVFRLDTQTQQFHKLPLPTAYYESFDIDSEGYIYLSAWNAILLGHLDTLEKTVHIPLSEKAWITSIQATDDGAYVSTLGTGLFFYDKHSEKMHCYTKGNHQLPSNYCYNTTKTQTGNILITTDKGITYYSPKNGLFTTIDLMENFPSAYIMDGCGIFASWQNKIFVGDTKGVTAFYEDEFHKVNTFHDTPDPYFTKLWINNQVIVPGDESGVLAQALPYTTELNLAYQQNNLIFRFALSDYEQLLSQKRFQYKLDGFDKKWIHTDQPEVHYTNLDPGTYTLRVATVVNNEKGELLKGREISIKLNISSPWYATWWAWILYVTAFMGCLYYFVSSRIAKRTLALSLEKERFEKQQIEQLNQEKLVFFTNVSHEFRTPLTLIISHVDILLQKTSLNASIYNQILRIRKNAQYMTNLISELLEFRRLEQNYKVLQIAEQDIVSFLKEIYFSFTEYAHSRNISYDFHLSDAPIQCWFDAKLLEKVFFNLISNAFKYTADNGTIILSGKVVGEEIEISISDTGTGIAAHEVPQIFKRFFQANNQKADEHSSSGTGIGLALSKTIVEKHHGSISVESELSKGSVFTVRLPRTVSAFQNDQNVQFSSQVKEKSIVPGSLTALPDAESYSADSADMKDAKEDPRTILLVEDNEELLQILQELFLPFYEVISATNGEEGLKQVYEHKVDLIISDIMMPKMSGTEMCLQIKNNIDYCHIPIILLTALNSTDQNIEGLNRGADDYITKPFHAQLLLARVNNLIRNRLLMQHQLEKKPISEIDLTSINLLDKDLLKRTSQIIEKHIDNTDFDIPVLCKELGIGRSLLYTKFKALTGMTPNNFILNFRLKYAATLLQKYPEIPIAEVSDRSGFSSPIYFSQCFKKQFGITPASYKKKNA